MADSRKFDIAIAGAGTAGAGAAYQLARTGWRVALLEARAIGKAGARWCNGVAPWQFDRSGIERPEPPEVRAKNAPTLLASPGGHDSFRVMAVPLWELDMRHLVARLQKLATQAGAMLFEKIEIESLEIGHDGRPARLDVTGAIPGQAPEPFSIEARLFVDATGRGGELRRRVPNLDRICPEVPKKHLCTAAQFVVQVKDKEGALAFLEENGLRPGETLTQLGREGGFSTINMVVEEGLEYAAILTGSIADGKHRTGPQLLEDIRQQNKWMGEVEFGGAGLIPLRRPYDRIAMPGIALIGDSACQVFSAHGSGIGVGLVAGKILAEALQGRADPGSLEATWSYQCRFQREIGPILAFYDSFRRASQRLSLQDVEAMFSGGFLGESMAAAGMEQKMASPSPTELIALARGALSHPSLSAKILPAIIRGNIAAALYRRYPQKPNVRALLQWSRTIARIFGERPDIR